MSKGLGVHCYPSNSSETFLWLSVSSLWQWKWFDRKPTVSVYTFPANLNACPLAFHTSTISHFQKYSELCAVPLHHQQCQSPSFPPPLREQGHRLHPGEPKHTHSLQNICWTDGISWIQTAVAHAHVWAIFNTQSAVFDCLESPNENAGLLPSSLSWFHGSQDQSQRCCHKDTSLDGSKSGGLSLLVRVCLFACLFVCVLDQGHSN